MNEKQKLLFGGVFATHTEWNENGEVVERDEFHMRVYWDLWNSGAMMKLKGAKLHVLLSIAMHADKNAECFPGVRYLATILPYNKNAISEAIKELIELGFLVRDQKRKEGGKFDHNNYKIKYSSPRPENRDTVETEENQEVEPCPENTDTVKTGSRKTGSRKKGLKKDLSSKKDPSKRKIDDDAPPISNPWDEDFQYKTFREMFVNQGAADIKKHDEHYPKFLDAINHVGYGQLIVAAEKYIQVEDKQSQIVLFLSGHYNQYIQKDKPVSKKKRKAVKLPKVMDAQDEINKGAQESAVALQARYDDIEVTMRKLRGGETVHVGE